MSNARPSNRLPNQVRNISLETGVMNHADGSCLIKCGGTHVLCSAVIENKVPRFLYGTGSGWVTAEYSMLPASTHTRNRREIAKQSGRTLEIQRLIGRSMRAAVNLNWLGEKQILIDCDVINADGGTRTAAITGSYVALKLAVDTMMRRENFKRNPIIRQIAAVSCGIYSGVPIIDLNYMEDSNVEVDMNFVFTKEGDLIEIQGTAENGTFTVEQMISMQQLASNNIKVLFEAQDQAIYGTANN